MELKDCMFHVVSMIYRGGIYKGESIGLERLYKHILPFLKILNRLEKIYLYIYLFIRCINYGQKNFTVYFEYASYATIRNAPMDFW